MLKSLRFIQFVLCVCVSVIAVADERPANLKTLQSGVTLTLLAEHPELVTPTGIDVDAQGRIYVVATHTHFRPDDYVGPENDEVLVFTPDEQGKLSRDVFYNATAATMDLELGRDAWVYLARRDKILRVRDSDNDGKADTVETVAQLETEADYPHNGLEALAWHPSGDLIFGIGENFAKRWTLTGRDGNKVSGTGEGGIFRCTPDGGALRRIAQGFWNPFGICVRDDGEIFAAENDPGERPPCRLLHVIEGGDYGYQRRYGNDAQHPYVGWNGELLGTLPMIRPCGEAPCGIQPLGNGLLVPSWSDHRIDYFPLNPQGASFSAERLALVQGGRYFRPACIAADPRNASPDRKSMVWYLTDWVDGRYQSHGYGRLWKLEIDLQKAQWVSPARTDAGQQQRDFARALRDGSRKASQTELLQFARESDPFLVRSAIIALARQADQLTAQEIKQWRPADRVAALLALKLAKPNAMEYVRFFLEDRDPAIQFEALRWIADSELTEMLPEVTRLLQRDDLDYRRFEAAIATLNTLRGNPEKGVRDTDLLLARVLDEQANPKLRAYALRMLPVQARAADKQQGLPAKRLPKPLNAAALKKMLAVGDFSLSLEVIRAMSANPLPMQDLLKQVATDPKLPARLRAEAIVGLSATVQQHLETFMELADHKQKMIREEALRGLRFAELDSQKLLQLAALSERYPESADSVAMLLERETVKRRRPAVEDTAAWLRRLGEIKSPPDPAAGERIFHHSKVTQCSNCHRHRGRGNVVGPDLSRISDVSRRETKRKFLLESILQPSLEMAPEYQPRQVVLTDGRVFTGIRLRSSTKEAMRDTNGQNRTFDRDEIEAMYESKVSFMPTGAVDSLTMRELRDLLAFLESR